MARDAFPDVAEQTEFYRRAYRAGRRAADRLPHPRYRRRQGAALPAARRGGQPGDGVAGDPHRARPAGDAAPAAARADARRRRARTARQVPDDRRGRRARSARASCSTSSWPAPAPRGGPLPRAVKVGVMLEVPSLLWQLPALLRADRFPVGRHQRSARSFSSPATAAIRGLPTATICCRRRCWRCSARSSRQCRAAGMPLSMCGEMAGNPIEAMALIALGFRTLSVATTAIGPVKDDGPQPRCRRACPLPRRDRRPPGSFVEGPT